jgi:hypothetical protein
LVCCKESPRVGGAAGFDVVGSGSTIAWTFNQIAALDVAARMKGRYPCPILGTFALGVKLFVAR